MTFKKGDRIRVRASCVGKCGQEGEIVEVRKYGKRVLLSVAFESGESVINGLYCEAVKTETAKEPTSAPKRIVPEKKNPKVLKRGKK